MKIRFSEMFWSFQGEAELAGTLGRYQEDNATRAVTIEADKGSILAKDAELEKDLDQVTRNDLRTPMRQQIPDKLQTPTQEVAEELENNDENDYNEDVAYLQQFGRAYSHHQEKTETTYYGKQT